LVANEKDSSRVAHALLICGQGSLLQELHALARTLGVEGHVHFLGLRRDIPRLLCAADGFALSSDSEGLPLVLLQASAAGLPIVATDVGGHSDVVIDGKTGILVPPDRPEEFFGAMRRLVDLSPAVRATMGAAGRDLVKRQFEAEFVASQWERLYSELLRHHAPGLNKPVS
jgi:glycosyltransferase involved in cell wall biosynthesis